MTTWVFGWKVLVRLLAFQLVGYLVMLPLVVVFGVLGEVELSAPIEAAVGILAMMVYGPLALAWAWRAVMPEMDEGSGFSRTWVGGNDGAAGALRRRIERGRERSQEREERAGGSGGDED